MSKNSKDMQPYWRPNFSNPATLPDIKVVRTDFIINFIAVTLVLIVGFYVLQREYRAYALGNTIEDMERRIRVADPDDNLNLKMSDRFREATRHIVELERFFGSPVMAHEFLAMMSELRPEGLIFNVISVSEGIKKQGTKSFAEYRVNISGEVKDPLMLSAFKKSLQSSSFVQGNSNMEYEIDESLQTRNAKTGIFPYRMMIVISPKQAEAAKEGAEG